jgi:WD40 repeat protein
MASFDESGYASHAVPRAVFSPDESLLATAVREKTGNQRDCRIRLWRTDDGELRHELRPFEQTTCESVEGLVWTPDGDYLLGVTKAHAFYTSRGISVWNVETGRHRGELTGGASRINGIALLPARGQLVAGSSDGNIRFWDIAESLRQIRAFEASLATERPGR